MMRIIDDHNHPNWYGYTHEKLVANMDEHGIEKTWLLSWEISPEELAANPYYYECMDPRGVAAPLNIVIEGLHRFPDRFIGGWAPDPRDRYVRAKLKAAVKIHGIKVCGELKCRMRYDNPDAIAMFRFCGQLGIPVLFHLECVKFILEKQCSDIYQWCEWYGGDMSVVENMCRLCPDTQFIGHGPGFWAEISGDVDQIDNQWASGPVQPGGRLIAALRKYKNLHCDLSAGSGANSLSRDVAHAKRFVEEFQDRILFGRDYFDRAQLDALEKLELSLPVQEKVFYRNAEALIAHAGEGA